VDELAVHAEASLNGLGLPGLRCQASAGGDDLTDATFRVPSQQRPDVLAHPRAPDLTCDSGGVFRAIELEDQNEMPVVDFGNVSGTPTGIDDKPHRVLCLLNWGRTPPRSRRASDDYVEPA
jgi:hypothetical protein